MGNSKHEIRNPRGTDGTNAQVPRTVARARSVSRFRRRPSELVSDSVVRTSCFGATLLIIPVLLAACGGCGRSDEGYFDQLRKGHEQARELAALLPTKQAIDAFHALKGRYPKDLEELKTADLVIPAPPAGTEYDYNPKTGEIKLRTTSPEKRQPGAK